MVEAVDARLAALSEALQVGAYPVSLDAFLGRLMRALDLDAAAVRLVQGEDLVLRASRGLDADAAAARIRMGDGVAGEAAVRRRPVVVKDATKMDVLEPWTRLGLQSIASLPLLDGPRLVGVLSFGTNERRELHGDVALLGMAAAWLAVAIERSRERDERVLRDVRERLLAEFSAAVNTAVEDLDETLRLTVERVAEQIGDVCAVWLLDDDREWLENVAVHAYAPASRAAVARVTSARRHVSERIAAEVVGSGRTLFLPVISPGTGSTLIAPEHADVTQELDVTSVISAPLKARGEVIGTLNIARTETGAPPYDRADRAFLEELANRAAVAIDNARLFRTVQAATRLQARADLAGDVGHDLNNLLTVIRGYVQLAQQRLGEDGNHELGEVMRAAERAAERVRDLLAFADGGRSTPEPPDR